VARALGTGERIKRGATARLQAVGIRAPSHNPASDNQIITAIASQLGRATAGVQTAKMPAASHNPAKITLLVCRSMFVNKASSLEANMLSEHNPASFCLQDKGVYMTH
jgi:hypothetical protein